MKSNAQAEALKLINQAKAKRLKNNNSSPSKEAANESPAPTNKWIKETKIDPSKKADGKVAGGNEKNPSLAAKSLERSDVVPDRVSNVATGYYIDEPSVLLNTTADGKKKFFDLMENKSPQSQNVLDERYSSDDDEDVVVNTSEWLQILEENNRKLANHKMLSDDTDASLSSKQDDPLSLTGEDLLSKERSQISSSKQAADSVSNVKDESITSSAKRADGEYSMSFESITDIRNQQFQPKSIFDTETVSAAKQELATFNDSLSSISMDQEPGESFINANGSLLKETPSANNNTFLKDESILKEINSVSKDSPIQHIQGVDEPLNGPESVLVDEGVVTSQLKEIKAQEHPTESSQIISNDSTIQKSTLVNTSSVISQYSESVKHPLQVEESPILVSKEPLAPYMTFAEMMKMNDQPTPIPAAKPIANQIQEKRIPGEKTKKAILQKANSKPRPSSSAGPVMKKLPPKPATVPANRPKSPTKKENPKKPSVNSEAPIAVPQPERKGSIPIIPQPPTTLPPSVLLENKELALLRAENFALSAKSKSLAAQLERIDSELESIKARANSKDQEISTLQQQVRFLENALQEEKETTSKSTLPKEPLSVELQKKLDDQEFLIRGYQTENEKFVLQIKDLKKSTKDLEHRNFLKLEAAQREIASLKTQFELAENSSKSIGSSMSTAKATLTIEELKGQVARLGHELETQNEDAKQQVAKYEALLADANRRAQEALSSHPDHIKKLMDEYQELQVAREKYIVEVETKLEWYVENQDIFNQVQQRIDRYEKTIKELNKVLETSQPSFGSVQRAPNDVRKIKQLENQILDLQEQLSNQSKVPLNLGLENSRPSIPHQQMVTYLKKIIHEMENDHAKEKLMHESALKDLNEKISVLSSRKIESIPVETIAKSADSHKDDAKPSLDSDVPNVNTTEVDSKYSEQLVKAQALEKKLKKKILELEADLLDLKSKNLAEKDSLQSDFSKKIQERDEIISGLENRHHNLQKDYHEKVGHLSIINPDIHAVRAELDNAIARNSSLQLKLELAEKAQQSLHESTLELMKSSQQQASKLALEHSKHSMDVVRNEMKKEHQIQTAALIETFKSRIYELETRLSSAHDPHSVLVSELQDKHIQLEKEYQRLLVAHQGCEERIKRSKEGIPPSLAELDRLSSRIQELEGSAKLRETLLKQEAERRQSKSDLENQSLKREIKVKEGQIKKFQAEIVAIVNGISKQRMSAAVQ